MRKSGILMHISSLPSDYGIGTLGSEAYKFVDFLKASSQSWWQVLPVCPTSYGDSPYQSNSAFAGNPYFIDLDILCEEGLLKKNEIKNYFFGDDPKKVDYKLLFDFRYPILRQAFSRFKKDEDYYHFVEENRFWLQDYAFFMAIKEHHHFRCWLYWDDDIKFMNPDAVESYKSKLSKNIEFYMFIQYEFFKQWQKLKKYANDNGIGIIGDMPIYVALDSAEVWHNPEFFELDENKQPVRVAGCPPDDFAPKGQLWGNPLYNWEYMKSREYDWWIKRLKMSFKLFDKVRIDHFRGFESYYAIKYESNDAICGEWVKGPGMDLFNTIRNELGNLDIIAEDLGYLTDDVHRMLKDCGYPGMKVLQFAFNPYEDNFYLPHNYQSNCVAYTGTHDNDTFTGWYAHTKGEEREFINNYLGVKRKSDAAEGGIRALMSSVAELVVIPIQDYLGKSSDSRMNIPSTVGGNWLYRIEKDDLSTELAEKISAITHTFRRG